jgi:tetratricopeptide (TPR) repeat protein
MSKVGRNQPCPCGSGRKYKRCCWDKDQAAWVDVLHETPPIFDALSAIGDDEDYDSAFVDLSNSVLALVDERRLDEADAVCEQLRTEYPDVHDWLMRKALVCEARGDYEQALDHYQRVIDWIDDNPDDFGPRTRESFCRDVERLKVMIEAKG